MITKDELAVHMQNVPNSSRHTFLYQYLDGSKQHMVTGKIVEACITNATCRQGIAGSFWMKYDAGDIIFATGGYHGKPLSTLLTLKCDFCEIKAPHS